ncbi:AAEL014086-PA [Aedes aegypti]|uniref:AAEL014086-PA n=1 Tax=Aedes aegypti TaxID=7159 RepID=Q16HB0_AEDAE|nr:AAEL014086-PA [Aedes aegypti]
MQKFKWILFDSHAVNQNATDVAIPQLIHSEVFLITENANHYNIWQFSKLFPTYPTTRQLYASWRLDSVPHLQLNSEVFADRWNLQGARLKASVVCSSSEINTSAKADKAVTTALANILNASVTFHCTPNWKQGLIHDLRTRSTDLGATPSYMTPDRLKSVQFLAMTGPLDYKFIYRSPKLSYTDNVFLLSFHDRVWLSIGAVILLATALQMIITRFESDHPEQLGVSDALLNMIGIASQQEALINPQSVSSRTLNIVMLISLMFLYICFSANIVALIQSPTARVRTLGDLLRWGFELSAQDSDINRIFMANESNSLRSTIYTTIQNSNGFLPVANGTERIRQGLAAFHGDTNQIYRYMIDQFDENEKCNLNEINFLPPLQGYYTVAKDSPLAEHVKYGLLKLRELGFLQREIAMHYQRKPACIGENLFVPISMIDAIFSIQLMGWALVLTIVIFALEVTWKRYNANLFVVRWIQRKIAKHKNK